MSNPLDPHDLAVIEKLAASGLWEEAGLVEALRRKELLKKQEILDAGPGLRYEDAQAAPPPELSPATLQLTEIERELIEDILTLFDDNGLSQEQTLSLLGQVSVLIDLVKRGQAQRNSQYIVDTFPRLALHPLRNPLRMSRSTRLSCPSPFGRTVGYLSVVLSPIRPGILKAMAWYGIVP